MTELTYHDGFVEGYGAGVRVALGDPTHEEIAAMAKAASAGDASGMGISEFLSGRRNAFSVSPDQLPTTSMTSPVNGQESARTKYAVYTTFGTQVLVEADSYLLTRDNVFEFDNPEGDTVASFPREFVASIVNFENELEEVDDETDDDEQYPECGVLDSEEFVDAVLDVIEGYVEATIKKQEEEKDAASPRQTPTLVKGVRKSDGRVEYGFILPEGFVNFNNLAGAEEGLEYEASGEDTNWGYADPADYTFSEVENG